jgi:hypothetical protein
MTNTMQERFDEIWNDKKLAELNGYGVNAIPDFIAIKSFIQSEKDLSKKEAQEEYKQFILNILDGIDIADGECNTKAIRLAINSKVI